MRTPLFLVATLSLAAGCATEMPNAVTAQHAANGTYYCWENKLIDNNGRLVCNWNADQKAACEDQVPSYIERSAVKSEPQHVHRCWNGEGLTAVTTR